MAIKDPLTAVVVTKDVIAQSNSWYAQGGIAGVLDPLDDFTKHANDTMAAGKGLCSEDVVNMVVRDAPERIHELVRIGTAFDKADGEIALTQEGGHSHPRIAHALGDATGKEIMRAIIETARRADNVQIWEKTFTIDLLTFEGRCRGALVSNADHGKTFIWAKETVIATGGAGAMYRETTNPSIATADGHAICFRAGCELRDMEFMQFHPTVLYIAGSSRHLITEAVRGEGGHLVDAYGYRFMKDYDDAMELAPRDIVSQSITRQMKKTNHPCVYLDLTPIDPARVEERFPHIRQVCAEFGIDIRTERIPVRPGAHYMIGGVTVDDEGRTSLPGLWGAGEVTSSGLHGANRLGSNSLLEGLVYGRRCGEAIAKLAAEAPDDFTAPPIRYELAERDHPDEELNVTDLRNSLSALMWRLVGITRDAEGLTAALDQVEFWSRYVLSRELTEAAGWELQNMLNVARVMIISALAREESRGVHFRTDFPDTSDKPAEHITVQVDSLA
ncbi:UNVERIFIED_CONTAM: hypothetical protein GTU68_061252 [Idotea baltica]|nr:hypothetical protein [Idotea baltica]